MHSYSSSGEGVGTKVLNAAIIVVSVAVLLGALTAPGARTSTAQVPAAQEEVVVTAPHTSHVS